LRQGGQNARFELKRRYERTLASTITWPRGSVRPGRSLRTVPLQNNEDGGDPASVVLAWQFEARDLAGLTRAR
jgi:hypothetical protein